MDSIDKHIIDGLRSSREETYNNQLRVLYKSMYPMVESYILNNSGNKAEAADIFQDAIVIFYNKIRKENLELTCSIQTYLIAVSKNLWLNRWKKIKKTTNADQLENEHSKDIIAVEEIMKKEENEMIHQLIQQLGKKCQEVLVSYYFDKMKMKDIAERMGFQNDQVAKNRKSSCLKKLRTLVNQTNFLTRNN